MAFDLDRLTAFSNEGFRVRRNNPDGSIPTVSRQLGFLGSVNLSGLQANSVISYRYDGTGAFTDLTIDLTAVGTSGIATVAEVVTALNASVPFAAVLLAAADTDSSRLIISNAAGETGHTYLELKGAIAETLGFGSYIGNTTGFGTHFIDCFNNSGAIGFPKEIVDFEEIEVEAGRGGLTTMTISALLKGLNPTLALTDELFELKALIQGGSFETVTGQSNMRYVPPTSLDTFLPVFSVEIYEAKYGQGSNLRSNISGYKRTNLENCNGIEADLTSDVRTWATYSFNLRVREYTDTSGNRRPGYTEDSLTLSEYTALALT